MSTKNPHFPFETKLYLKPVIDFWREKAESTQAPQLKRYITDMLARVDQVPALAEPIEDYDIIEENRELVDFIISSLIPYSIGEDSFLAIIEPYSLNVIYGTKGFLGHLEAIGRNKKSEANKRADKGLFAAYGQLLNQFYGLDVGQVCFGNFIMEDEKTGLTQTYRLDFDGRFLTVILKGELPELTMEQREAIIRNPHDFDYLMKIIPPRLFEFHGVTILTAVDITEQESINTIKRELMDKDTILESSRFNQLQEQMRILLDSPEMVFHLIAFREDEILLLNTSVCMDEYCVYHNSMRFKYKDYAGSRFEQILRDRKPLIVEDLTKLKDPGRFEKEKLAKGVRSLMIAPLFLDDEIIGSLTLGSPVPGDLSPADVAKITSLLSDFALAVKRSLEEFENSVQRVIQKQYTSIHPAVEWKFKNSALGYIEDTRMGRHPEVKPVIFENVFPLYSATDIRSSSTYRNKAIQQDLVEHLNLAKQIIDRSSEAKNLPVFDELRFRVERHLDTILSSLDTGDELRIIAFLREEIETHFSYLETLGPEIKSLIDQYRDSIDRETGSFYKERKSYDDSVNAINQAISEYVDAAQAKAQDMFPHYFDRYSTDGVDQSIYIGASMAEHGDFDMIHLKNLRLWQLIVLANISRNMEELKKTLPVPLETTHLLVVQDVPLTICFHLEEKRFRVDGAYNIRYEIMKKRIDKAVIKETGERLTQPGKIAIVYSQDSEAGEYEKYIEYMQARGYFTGETEYLLLEDLQGIKGLKALRVTVNNDKDIDTGDLVMDIARKLHDGD